MLSSFIDAKLAYTETTSVAGIPFSDDIKIALDNPFLPQTIQDQIPIVQGLGPGPASIFVARDNLGSEVNQGTDAERTTFRISGGFRGEIFDTGLNYEASYNYGKTDANITNRNARLNDRYFTGIDAVALTAADLDGTNPNLAFGAGGIGTLNAIRGGEDLVIDATSAQIGDIVCRSELTGVPSPGSAFVGGPPAFPDGTVINGVDVSPDPFGADESCLRVLSHSQSAMDNVRRLTSWGQAQFRVPERTLRSWILRMRMIFRKNSCF